MPKLNPYLNFAGNAEEAFQFYKSVFGGEFSSLVRFTDMPMPGVEVPKEDQDKIMHISLPIGDENVLMASDTLEAFGQKLSLGNNNYVSVHTDTKQEADKIFNGLSAGGVIEQQIADQPWGDYWGAFKDRFGVLWMVNFSQQQTG